MGVQGCYFTNTNCFSFGVSFENPTKMDKVEEKEEKKVRVGRDC